MTVLVVLRGPGRGGASISFYLSGLPCLAAGPLLGRVRWDSSEVAFLVVVCGAWCPVCVPPCLSCRVMDLNLDIEI